MFLRGKTPNNIFTLSFMVGIGLLLSNSIALPLQQHQVNLDSNAINSNANLENSTNYQTSYDTSLLSSGTNAGWASSKPFMLSSSANSGNSFAYRDSGFLMGSGANDRGQLGIGTSGSSTNVGEPFALYKEGNQQTPFYNSIDYRIGGTVNGVIDSTGKLYTAGASSWGGIGRGYTTSQGYYANTVFAEVATQSSDWVSDEAKANALPDDYQAVSISTGTFSNLLLLNDGTLYGAGRQSALGLATSTIYQTHFTRLDGRVTGLPAATSNNKIKDIGVSYYGSWILYENGELYMTYSSSTYSGQFHLVASDIKFFDVADDANAGRVYAVNTSNQILSCTTSSTTLSTLVATPNGTVTQVRGTQNGGWGYLNSNNELYLSTTAAIDAAGTAPGASNSSASRTTFYKMDDVAFFDLSALSATTMSYGVLYVGGNMTVWGDNSFGQLGNGSVGNPDPEDEDYVESTPETGTKDDVTFSPEDIPNVEEDELKDPEDVVFSDEPTVIPISHIPPATF